ncbi:hypothetical protein C8Q78DRAFT_977503 [Trametes maxima]|nr:hypothetical protein C8Q78DRAFT_977503 [Trametes maxima]
MPITITHNSSPPLPIPDDFGVIVPRPLKRRKLDVPACVQCENQRKERRKRMESALKAIEKLILSKRNAFAGGAHGLQATRARCIESQLQMIIHKNRSVRDASERAAESHGFAAQWGRRMVRSWTKAWVAHRELPVSHRGKHIKAFSLLEDSEIRAELRAYLRSNKWAMNPSKLTEFSLGRMVPAAADQYLHQIINSEMPRGLRQYMEVELFPRVHLRPGKGISMRTAQRRLVLVAHDEMTAQSNDGQSKSWVLEGEYPLKKKGAGRGIHRSDVICSTVGWLQDAGQSLEYGKNYEGYWTGELFVKQLQEKIIPAFEAAHGPGYQALIMVDNSQGHSAYSDDALLTSRMNLRPGGKQARMRDGWYLREGIKVIQKMVFPQDHTKFPDMPKGMKEILEERNCDYTFSTLQENIPRALASVSTELIRKWEHRSIRWMEAYRSGLDSRDAQEQVKAFSSRRYKSHCRIPETLARTLDA